MRTHLASLIIAMLALSYMVSCAYADESPASTFLYKTEGKRDPFAPLVDKDGKLMVQYGAINSINDVILEGILYDPEGKSLVILNSLILKENDKVSNIVVKKIEKDRVILTCAGEEYIFKLKE